MEKKRSKLNFHDDDDDKPPSRSSGNVFVFGVGSLRFNLRLVKSDTELPMALHRYDNSSKGAALPRRNDAEMSPVNSSHASA